MVRSLRSGSDSYFNYFKGSPLTVPVISLKMIFKGSCVDIALIIQIKLIIGIIATSENDP